MIKKSAPIKPKEYAVEPTLTIKPTNIKETQTPATTIENETTILVKANNRGTKTITETLIQEKTKEIMGQDKITN